MCCGSAALAVCSVRIREVFHYCLCVPWVVPWTHFEHSGSPHPHFSLKSE